MKDEVIIANMCNYQCSLALNEHFSPDEADV